MKTSAEQNNELRDMRQIEEVFFWDRTKEEYVNDTDVGHFLSDATSNYEIWIQCRCLSDLQRKKLDAKLVRWEDTVLEGGRKTLHLWALKEDATCKLSIYYGRMCLLQILSDRTRLAEHINRRRQDFRDQGKPVD